MIISQNKDVNDGEMLKYIFIYTDSMQPVTNSWSPSKCMMSQYEMF